ncbi:SDR family oxidoreductase [Actinotalea sp. M2MS4P-6]|uniref:SDR family oxidoreductase n=1 Tax=Actinotalea sp. M2MS4P-6 TaxID=2983762 RepID=UPI0021E3C7AF|nr:SDR family oxidoreductase [Actinotalea sp. M2MS4P-6]MCV2395892.1 SDR family oxidoreductase [Actinotalea sp. M2MS4P-6]
MDKDVVVIIGVGGMGLTLAPRISAGRRVLLADFSEQAMDSVAERLGGTGYDVTTHRVDVADQQSMAGLADAAASLGRVAQVAHTAGLSPVQAPADAIFGVDLLGVAHMLEEFARVIAPGGAGVVIASMAGHMAAGLPAELERALATVPAKDLLAIPALEAEAFADPGAAYSLAKRGNILRVQAAAVPWGKRGARVNSISPGIIATPMGMAELGGAHGEQMRQMIAMSGSGRVGTPEDIARAAEFLLDPQSSFITGTDLLVDGGVVAAARTLAPPAAQPAGKS